MIVPRIGVGRLFSTESLRKFIQSPPELYRLATKFSGQSALETKANELIDLSEKVHKLRLTRMQLLSLPAASVKGRNKELISLGLGAVSGALSLSFHPAFALIFIVSYRMYRSASKPMRDRLQGAENAKSIQSEILEINGKIDEIVSEIKNSIPPE